MAYGMQPPGDPTAVMGRRIVAYIVDSLLISGIFIAVMALTKNNAYTRAPSGACQILRDRGFSGQCLQFGSRVYTWKSGGAAAGYGSSALASFLDLVVLQGITGASIGKLIMRLRVVNAQGEPCGVGRAFVRWLLLVVDGACFIVGLLVALLTQPHRRIGDMAAGTYVVALAHAGRPVAGAPQAAYPAAPQYQYAYPQPGAPGWAPPGAAPQPGAPGWAPPGAAPPPPPGWGAPPPPPPTWGAPPPPPPSEWGAPPPAAPAAEPAPPAWNAPPAPPSPPPAPTEPPATEPSQADRPPPGSPPAAGETWWNKALDGDDEPEE